MARELTDAAKAAKAIRAELKAIGVKARVKSQTYSGGDSVDVYTTDLTPEVMAQVNTICKKYQEGHFDGMTDCYEYTNTNSELTAQVKYVFVENSASDDMITNILNWIDSKDAGKQFDTDAKVKEFFRDYSMSRYNLARKMFRGYDLFGGFWQVA